jgi:phage recombination protein Bet
MPSDLVVALPEPVVRRGLDEFQWRTLKHTLYAGAASESIYLVVDYCRAMQLDPMRRPVHIVPMEVRIAGTDRTEWRDVPMPGIYMWRTIASRTGLYLGHSAPVYGPLIEVKGVKAPESCAMTFYRLHPSTGQRLDFPIQTYFREVVATNREGKPNARWTRAPIQMLTKCTEAAGLREAFPDEFGGQQTADEMDGQRAIDAPVVDAEQPSLVEPANYAEWLTDLHAVADNGADAFALAWKESSPDLRGYLMGTDPDGYEQLKAHAAAVSAPADEPEE